MNQLQIFVNPEFGEVRSVLLDGEPWFVGKDVADALGYKNNRQAIASNVGEEDKGVHSVDTPSGEQVMTIINESGLYSLIFGSKLSRAKEFKRWVTSEVLPALRKTGSYSLPAVPSTSLDILAEQHRALGGVIQSLRDQERAIRAQEERITAVETAAADVDRRLSEAVSVFSAPSFSPDLWQEQANRAINELVETQGLNHQKYRRQLYDRVDSVAGVDIQARQTRMRNRMKAAGATATRTKEVSKLSVIAADKKLRAVFDSILREERAKLCFAAKNE